jgi:DNA-binding NtrC family response regulator
LIGANYHMQRIYDLIRTLSDTDVSVLIQGETGTGKELVARAIHYNSPRRSQPFVKVDCAALTETLLESELFGHVTGAFTGATRDRVGRFKSADGGTLFLDEVGNIPLVLQTKLLRVLQDRQFERVGDDKTISVDVRVTAASNTPLETLVNKGNFRRDLFYRLNIVAIHLPPLRERKEDIPLLVAHFLERFHQKHNRVVKRLSRAAMNKLLSHDWPGNVRELENALEQAVVLSRGDVIEPQDLGIAHPEPVSPAESPTTLKAILRDAERSAIFNALREANWNKEMAAEHLGISRSSLYEKLKGYGME